MLLRLTAALLLATTPIVAQAPRFDRDVRPILAAKCFACHGPDAGQRKAKLRLDVRAVALERGVLVPGDAEASPLVERIEHADPEERMPPPQADLTLTDAERATLRAWVDAGAEYQEHWAFVPPARPAVPEDPTGWAEGAVDAFVLARLRARGLEPSPPAEPATLVRRLALDLTGLPPAPEQVRAFVADPSPAAYAALVDELLASPHHGEHMAHAWLDAARYADSNGYQQDGDRQQWPWRDWLIQALDDDRPLDQLAVEMLAGDLLPEAEVDQRVATAFHRNHPINNEGGALADETRFHYVVDRVHTTATTFLGLTMACAQCHDHKFDPITQVDYYRFFALFDNVDEDGRVNASRQNTYHSFQLSKPYLQLGDQATRAELKAARARLDAAGKAYGTVRKAIDAAESAWLRGATPEQIAGSPPRIASAILKSRGTVLTGPERKIVRSFFVPQVAGETAWIRLQSDLDAAQAEVARLHEDLPMVMVMAEREQPRETRVHRRGAYDQPTGEPLTADIPAALGSLGDLPRNRLGFARWLTRRDHPLFARVLVNRLWQQVFGRGLVATPEDFGAMGSRPSHPALLDWLAAELVENGYRQKALLRAIVHSATYRQASRVTAAHLERDPDNAWLGRSARHRLSSFALRDQALALAGLLDRTRFGPPVYPRHPEGLWLDVSFEVFAYPHGRAREQHRRSLYGFFRRTVKPPNLFDSASRETCSVRPRRTNSPLHALVLLNEPSYVEAARALGARFAAQAGDDTARLAALFEHATCRAPDAFELATLEHALHAAPDRDAGWTRVALTVLNLDEVLCRP